MKKLIYLAISVLILQSCSPETRETDEVADMELNANSVDDQAYRNVVSRQAAGRWQGTIPCADCPGTIYTLAVYPDSTFREEMIYKDRSKEAFIQTGNWEILPDSVITLRGDKQRNSRIQVTANRGLIILDTQGEKVTGALAEDYKLHKIGYDDMLEDTEEIWQQKQQQGIDFIALGNEPEWILEIDNEKLMTLKTHASAKLNLTFPAVKPEHSVTGDTIFYMAQTETGEVTITLRKQPCSNPKFATTFNYAVDLKINNKLLEGCGRFLNDTRLSSKWVLQMLNNEVMVADSFPKGAPFITFDLSNNKVTGNGGCNRFTGSVFTEGSQLRFSPLVSTKMSCPQINTEQNFMKVLSSPNLTFSIDPGRLTILQNGKPAAIFRKAD